MRRHPLFGAYVALACVCVLWGTTYLGIRIAVAELPPAALMCVRYLISGTLISLAALLRGAKFPRGRDLWTTAAFGVLTVGVGTGALSFAEVSVPSGIASLFVATGSFWLVGAEAAMPGGEPLHAPTLGAMLIGATGAALLFVPDNTLVSRAQLMAGFGLIQLGYLGWGFGSVWQKRRAASQASAVHPIVSAGVQQLAVGAAFALPALLGPRPHWTTRGIEATLYLAIFGGTLGYSAYVIAVTTLPVAITSIYSYINPLVAVLLGVWLYGEPFTIREAAAMALIFIGVALVKQAQSRRARTKAALGDR